MPLSPEQTATEMYQSAVANVRKSAKRLSAPRSAAKSSKTAKCGLIADESDDNMAAKMDWLIDDYVNSPVKKKQRRSSEK